MCVSEQTFTVSDNGLSPDRRHAIIWTNAGILLIRALGANFSEILSKSHTIPFKKMYFIMSSVKWRSSFLGLNVWRYDKEFLHFIKFETNYIHKQINKTLKQCHRLLKMHNKIVHLNLSWRWLKKNCTLMNVLCSAHFIQNELIWARITELTPNMHFSAGIETGVIHLDLKVFWSFDSDLQETAFNVALVYWSRPTKGYYKYQCTLVVWPCYAIESLKVCITDYDSPDSKVPGANMEPIWGRQDPDGPRVGPMSFTIWTILFASYYTYLYITLRSSLFGVQMDNRWNDFWGPFYWYGLTLIPPWISNYIHYNVGWNYFSIPKFQRRNRWSLE